MKLSIIISSTRASRKGPAVAQWVESVVRESALFEVVEVVDLKKLNLPFMDEPKHPNLQQYTHQHTKDWSAQIDSSSAFIFVTAEYNHGIPAPLKNAIDYLSKEWANKPLAIVGYGGISGGTRAIQQLKQIASAVKLHAFDGVILPFFSKQIDEDGVFQATAHNRIAADKMVQELAQLARSYQVFRV